MRSVRWKTFIFSTPHVQNLFDDLSYRYYWVVSLSRAVELTSNGTSTLGVLLVDMNYSSIEQILKKGECWKFFGVCLPDRRKG